MCPLERSRPTHRVSLQVHFGWRLRPRERASHCRAAAMYVAATARRAAAVRRPAGRSRDIPPLPSEAAQAWKQPILPTHRVLRVACSSLVTNSVRLMPPLLAPTSLWPRLPWEILSPLRRPRRASMLRPHALRTGDLFQTARRGLRSAAAVVGGDVRLRARADVSTVGSRVPAMVNMPW